MKDNSYLESLIENMNENTSLSQLQDYVNEMVHVRGFANETPQDTLLLLTEELGELAKEVRKSCTAIKNDKSKVQTDNLEGEVADVLLMLIALRRTLNIDLLTALKNKELKNCNRHWE